MRKRKVTQTQFQAQTWNPLLMWNGINPIPTDEMAKYRDNDRENPFLKYYNEFVSLYAEAVKQAPSKHICFGLEADFSDTDEGIGGFYDGGFVPVELFDLPADVERYMRYAWPRDPFSESGKYMRYLGSINLGVWPQVLHDMSYVTTTNGYDNYNQSFAFGYRSHTNGIRSFFDKSLWMHLFTSRQAEFDSPTPDCNVQISSEHDFTRMSEEVQKIVRSVYTNKNWTKEQIREHIVKWQNEHTEEAEYIKGHKKYFKNLRPRFYYDGPYPYPDRIANLMEKEDGIFSWKGGDVQVYGLPRSQQEARRYISPNSYNGIRACTPMFSFNDGEHDMTHQFYADAFMLDEYNHKQAYCKLDSSCT